TINEWDLLAQKYAKVFQPRFARLYRAMAEVLAHTDHDQETVRVLDFACGVGEPTKTVAEYLASLGTGRKWHFIAADSSAGMIGVAQKQALSWTHPSVSMETTVLDLDKQDLAALAPLDSIIVSLGFMYMPARLEYLSKMKQALVAGGLLITSHWDHPSKVPFLRILKQTNAYMGGTPIDLQELENNDASFSLWRPETFSGVLHLAGFQVVECKTIDMPMAFDRIQDLLEFGDPVWFNDPVALAKAVDYANGLAAQELGVDRAVVAKAPFVLQNKGVVVVARPV
ncbi:hypothetical protein HDU91_000715, partial [Kappamyces sp. JEL0680]